MLIHQREHLCLLGLYQGHGTSKALDGFILLFFSSFGYQIAKRLDQRGYNVFAGCLTQEGEEKLGTSSSSRLRTVSLNVTDSQSIRNAFQFVKDALPEGQGAFSKFPIVIVVVEAVYV